MGSNFKKKGSFLIYRSTVAWLGANKGYNWPHIDYNAKSTEVKRKIKEGEDNIKIKLGKQVIVFPFGCTLHDKFRAKRGILGCLNNRLVRIRFLLHLKKIVPEDKIFN